jgi:hypothetical protein
VHRGLLWSRWKALVGRVCKPIGIRARTLLYRIEGGFNPGSHEVGHSRKLGSKLSHSDEARKPDPEIRSEFAGSGCHTADCPILPFDGAVRLNSDQTGMTRCANGLRKTFVLMQMDSADGQARNKLDTYYTVIVKYNSIGQRLTSHLITRTSVRQREIWPKVKKNGKS